MYFTWMFLLLTICFLLTCYSWLIRPYKYWIKRGVPQGQPKPILGNFWKILFKNFADVVQENYNAISQARFVGMYNLTRPVLLLRDPDLIKQLIVTDCGHFVDRSPIFPEDVDPLWAKNLFALSGQKWRDMRNTLSPAFTGSKMKHMFASISELSEKFCHYFLDQDQECVTIDTKDTFTRYTNDVIGHVVFRVDCNSLQDRNNEFYRMGVQATDLNNTLYKRLIFLLHMIFPCLSKIIRVGLFSPKVSKFFSDLVGNYSRNGNQHNQERKDMIQLLLNEGRNRGNIQNTSTTDDSFETAQELESLRTQNAQKVALTDEDITAQALLFYFAGFETVSSQITFAVYELAINPHVQEKLRQEIDETLLACNGTITYQALTRMKYMDMVIAETLRKWPATLGVDRLCTKPYIIEPTTPDEVPVHLTEDDSIFIPIFGLQRDPQYFPEPEQFDPERFSDENKARYKQYYLPFGIGPRQCIGNRFALLEIKILIFNLLKHFTIVPVKKTQIPVTLRAMSFTLTPRGTLWLGLKRRTHVKDLIQF